MLRFAFRITRRVGVLSLPFPLLSLRREAHLRGRAFDPPAFLDSLEVTIDLDVVRGLLLVLAVLLLESGDVAVLALPDVVAEI